MLNLQALNSATKYPSILSYHKHGNKGLLTEELNCVPPSGAQVLLGCTEKVNGSNSRIILFLDNGKWRFIIGSREVLLYSNGDFLIREEYSIVQTLLPLAERLQKQIVYELREDALNTFYFEVFGDSKQPESKNYSDFHSPSFRMFDVSVVSLDTLDKPIEEIAAWRERGGQNFHNEAGLQDAKNKLDLNLVPRHWGIQLPTKIEDIYKWLQENMPETGCLLDSSGKGRAEGVVVRNSDRSFITKIRFEDYERHFGKLGVIK
jgi:hypothetical protein